MFCSKQIPQRGNLTGDLGPKGLKRPAPSGAYAQPDESGIHVFTPCFFKPVLIL
jgi:hypothetical protein